MGDPQEKGRGSITSSPRHQRGNRCTSETKKQVAKSYWQRKDAGTASDSRVRSRCKKDRHEGNKSSERRGKEGGPGRCSFYRKGRTGGTWSKEENNKKKVGGKEEGQ